MISGKLTLAMLFLTAPAVWAQFSRADMTKVATDRFDTAATTLNFEFDLAEAAVIKNRFSKRTLRVDIGQVKDVYRGSDKSDTAKKDARESLKAIRDKYNSRINTILTPEQAKAWKRMQKDWKDDLVLPKS